MFSRDDLKMRYFSCFTAQLVATGCIASLQRVLGSKTARDAHDLTWEVHLQILDRIVLESLNDWKESLLPTPKAPVDLFTSHIPDLFAPFSSNSFDRCMSRQQ